MAAVALLPEKGKTFNIDNVRVIKILGSGLLASTVMNGMIFKRDIEGDVKKAEDAKIAVYSCAVDISQTETKGTVLIKSADELLQYSNREEDLLEKVCLKLDFQFSIGPFFHTLRQEASCVTISCKFQIFTRLKKLCFLFFCKSSCLFLQQIKAIADSGVKVVVSGGKMGDLALHFINKYKLLAVRLMSKFDIRRLANTVGAIVLSTLVPPTADVQGHCDLVYLDEIGDTSVVVFKQEKVEGAISTIVLRGATENSMDDVERAIDDGVNNFKAITKVRKKNDFITRKI